MTLKSEKKALPIPEELSNDARYYWPKTGWPTASGVKQFVNGTATKPQARLDVLTGLRHLSEPGSSQTLVAAGALIVALAALILSLPVSDNVLLDQNIFSMAAVLLLVALACYAFFEASKRDTQRKIALAWLQAFEEGIK